MDRALFGPAGNCDRFYADGNKHSIEAFKWLYDNGIDAYEYQCGNGIRTKLETFVKLGEEARKFNIALSLHAPYYISLSGVEEDKRLKSLDYIKASVDAAEALGADRVVIHTGSAAKISREEALSLAKDTILRTLDMLGETGVTLCLETMGKKNQLGTLEEVVKLCSVDKRLSPCVDFGHLNARDVGGVFVTKDDYLRVFDFIGEKLGKDKAKHLHCHFSKIEYTNQGEKKHLTFEDNEFGPDFEPLCEAIAREGLCPRIICESAGTQADDALAMKKSYLRYYS
ncbi:MAG: endonuclease IV [Ruminococcaceae bacterium]|nr:endonuclease IV [Oscillospiraceae bacterium]